MKLVCRIIVISIFFFLQQSFFAQEKNGTLINFEEAIFSRNSDDAKKYLTILNSDESFRNSMNYYVANVEYFTSKLNYNKALEFSEKAKVYSEKSNSSLDKALNLYIMAKISFIGTGYKETVEYCNEALSIIKNEKNVDLLKIKLYGLLGKVNNKTNSYSEDFRRNTFEAYRLAEKINYPWLIINGLQDISTMYMILNNIKGSQRNRTNMVNYLKKSIQYIDRHADQIKNTKLVIIVYNNYASMINDNPYDGKSVEERLKEAIFYINKAIRITEDNHLEKEMPIVYTTYGEIFLNQKNYQKAEEYFLKCYKLISTDIRQEQYVYAIFTMKSLANIYKDRGDLEKTYKFQSEAIKYMDELSKYRLDEKNKFIDAYYNSNERIQKLFELEKESFKFSKQRNIFIGLILFAVLFIWFLINKQKNKTILARQKTELLRSEKYETELKLQLELEERARLKAEQELLTLQQEQLQMQNLATVIQLEKKNNFINELKETISSKKDVNIESLIKNEKLQDEDFVEIQNFIQDIHPHFFKKLNTKSPSKLSPLDLKYAAYILLNFDNQKIANVLKVEQNTVRMTKYRLKQKLGLKKDDDLSLFIHNLEA